MRSAGRHWDRCFPYNGKSVGASLRGGGQDQSAVRAGRPVQRDNSPARGQAVLLGFYKAGHVALAIDASITAGQALRVNELAALRKVPAILPGRGPDCGGCGVAATGR